MVSSYELHLDGGIALRRKLCIALGFVSCDLHMCVSAETMRRLGDARLHLLQFGVADPGPDVIGQPECMVATTVEDNQKTNKAKSQGEVCANLQRQLQLMIQRTALQ